ncbi:hypothetical protein TNCV_2017031 [Trichonephila clavipes]|nr:hypothetical protein TNCV_2017031 [Trichonephila clavipes]
MKNALGQNSKFHVSVVAVRFQLTPLLISVCRVGGHPPVTLSSLCGAISASSVLSGGLTRPLLLGITTDQLRRRVATEWSN